MDRGAVSRPGSTAPGSRSRAVLGRGRAGYAARPGAGATTPRHAPRAGRAGQNAPASITGQAGGQGVSRAPGIVEINQDAQGGAGAISRADLAQARRAQGSRAGLAGKKNYFLFFIFAFNCPFVPCANCANCAKRAARLYTRRGASIVALIFGTSPLCQMCQTFYALAQAGRIYRAQVDAQAGESCGAVLGELSAILPGQGSSRPVRPARGQQKAPRQIAQALKPGMKNRASVQKTSL